MSQLPETAVSLIDQFADLPDNQQTFYGSLFRRQVEGNAVSEGEDYLPALAEHLHKQGENLLALTVIDRCGLSESQLIDEAGLYENLLLTKIKVLHALHSYGRARRLAEKMRVSIAVASLQLTGNLASVIKSQALAEPSTDKRKQLLEQSLALYELVFVEPLFEGSYWLGVNALAIASCLGKHAFVKAHLETVRRDCLKSSNASVDRQGGPDFWTMATVAELDLIELLNENDAEPEQILSMLKSYERAEALCQTLQERKSARKNTQLLLSYFSERRPEQASALRKAIDGKLRPARVAIFTGHRIDAPDRLEARFPPETATTCAEVLADFIRDQKIDIGYSSAANGGDLLFVDGLLANQRTANIVMPFDEEQFRDASLAVAGSGEDEWTERFNQLLHGERDGAVVWHASQSTVDQAGMDPYYAHCNDVILGMARLKARELDGELVGVAVMEPGDDNTIGGTHAAVKAWQSAGIHVAAWSPQSQVWARLEPTPATQARTDSIANTAAVAKEPKPESAAAAAAAAADTTVSRTLLFADVLGFSGLADSQVASYCEVVLGEVQKLVAESQNPPLELNTWGDGLFMVFESAPQGADFALALCELMKRGNRELLWANAGLPEELAMRVSLHTSPVKQIINPLTQNPSHWGHNVSVAARIEPITPANQVYGSAATAALIAAEGRADLAADFVGMVPLAKSFGTLELFRVYKSKSA